MSTTKIEAQATKDEPVNLPFGFVSLKGEPIQIKSVKVDVLVNNHVAEVTSTLTYQNKEKTPVSSVFSFPQDERTAVYQLEADIGGKQIVANVQRKPQAYLTKEDAADDGTAAMVYKGDNSNKDVISCMLGNVPAQSEATVVMKYVTELPQESDGQLSFTLPTVLNPRCSPGKGDKKVVKGGKNVPPSKVPYTFSMTASIKSNCKVSSVTSNNVKLSVTFEEDNKKAKVIMGDDFKFDSDLQLHILYEEPYGPQVVIENVNPKDEGMYKKVMFSFQPDLKKVSMASGGEYVFIIENSGIMEGSKILYAKKTLQLFLRSLPPDSFFNIIAFGEKVNSLFRNSNKYTEKTFKEALLFLNKMKTDRVSGAPIFKPLDHIYGKKPVSVHPRKVFLLSGGNTIHGITITAKITDLVKKQSQKTKTRIFILAMGYGRSSELLKDVTRVGGGRIEFIVDEKNLQSKAIALLRYSMQPAITNVQVKWDMPSNLTLNLVPREPPHVISAGERLVLFAAIRGVDENTTYPTSTVTLKGMQDGKAISHSINFDVHDSKGMLVSAPFRHLATKTEIKLLEDKEEETVTLHDPVRPYWQEFCDEVYNLRSKIMNLSCHSNVISKYTFYCAMDDKGKDVVEKPGDKFCKVPTLTDIFICELKCKQDLFCKANLKSCGLFEGGDSLEISSSMAACVSDDSGGAVLVLDDDQMMTILSLQQFQGQWTVSNELLQLIGIAKEDIEKNDISEDESVVCTAIVLGWLMEMYPHRQEEWEMIEAKALSWISSHSQTAPVEDIIQHATQTLKLY